VPRSRTPLFVSFDTNAYSPVVRPQLGKVFTTGWWPLSRDRMLSKKRRIAWCYVQRCVRLGRIRAAIPEAAFASEVLPNAERIDFLLAVGTPRAAIPPTIPDGRRALIKEAFGLGFTVLHAGRIGYGEIVGVSENQWARDERHSSEERQARFSRFIRHFADFPLEAVRSFGELLSAKHGLASQKQGIARDAQMMGVTGDRLLWREGIEAESKLPMMHATSEVFMKALRHKLADWADFDMLAAHYAYDYDLLCSEDTGSPRSDSIFGPQYGSDVTGQFGVRVVSLAELAARCWQDFRFPLRSWR
jgi:signal transduction histidine kinase